MVNVGKYTRHRRYGEGMGPLDPHETHHVGPSGTSGRIGMLLAEVMLLRGLAVAARFFLVGDVCSMPVRSISTKSHLRKCFICREYLPTFPL